MFPTISGIFLSVNGMCLVFFHSILEDLNKNRHLIYSNITFFSISRWGKRKFLIKNINLHKNSQEIEYRILSII